MRYLLTDTAFLPKTDSDSDYFICHIFLYIIEYIRSIILPEEKIIKQNMTGHLH